jgi:hypothetical protein
VIFALDGIKGALALFSIGFFRRQAGSKGSQLIPCIFETRLGRLVPVNEDRITVRIMSQRAKRRLLVEPACRVLIVVVRAERVAHRKAQHLRRRKTTGGIRRQEGRLDVRDD